MTHGWEERNQETSSFFPTSTLVNFLSLLKPFILLLISSKKNHNTCPKCPLMAGPHSWIRACALLFASLSMTHQKSKNPSLSKRTLRETSPKITRTNFMQPQKYTDHTKLFWDYSDQFPNSYQFGIKQNQILRPSVKHL